MLRFHIEQFAIAPKDVRAAKELLSAMGATQWTLDNVHAVGEVFDKPVKNEADLHFNYQLGSDKTLEFEILDYTLFSENWLEGCGVPGSLVSHLGMHCSADDLVEWRKFFAGRGIGVAQEVLTQSHTNPAIKDSRRYQYVIFDTRDILGVDLKFIVRKEVQA